MLHFTPIQELGESNSSYSLFEQISINSKLFPNQTLELPQKEKLLKNVLDTLRSKEYNVLTMSDVVWNHTANNSPWLKVINSRKFNINFII